MKLTKTLLAMLLAALMVLSVVGCTKKIDVTEYTQPTAAPAKTETKTEAKTETKTETKTEAQPTEEPVKELTYADGTEGGCRLQQHQDRHHLRS